MIGDPPIATSGYFELLLDDGSVHYTQPTAGITADFVSVTLISVTKVDNGWTVTKWEAPGC